MRHAVKSHFTALAAALIAAAFWHAAAADDRSGRHRDHDVARQGLERGEMVPLESVLAEVRKSVPGDLAAVELEFEHGAWIYEIKLIAPSGVLTKVIVDARTGRILRTRVK